MTTVYVWVLGAGFLGLCAGAVMRFVARFEEVV